MSETYFPRYTEKVQSHDTTIAPDERLPMAQTVLMGVQHVVAMFGATILAPLLMGLTRMSPSSCRGSVRCCSTS